MFKQIDLFNEKNIFFLIIFCIIGVVLISIIINLSRLPTKYVFQDDILDMNGELKPIPIELYLKETKQAVHSTKKSPHKKKKRLNKHEEECRRILESIFKGKKFPNIRPDWLINEITGNSLEIDCFNEELKLGLEYDGIQHSEQDDHFHKNKQQYEYQKLKDRMKDKMCKEKGIDLIRVPHFIKFEKLEDYIREKLKKIGRLS